MSLLVIGGESDGRRINVPGNMHRWRLTENETYHRLKLAATDPGSESSVKYFEVMVLDSLTDAEALELLIHNYRARS